MNPHVSVLESSWPFTKIHLCSKHDLNNPNLHNHSDLQLYFFLELRNIAQQRYVLLSRHVRAVVQVRGSPACAQSALTPPTLTQRMEANTWRMEELNSRTDTLCCRVPQ